MAVVPEIGLGYLTVSSQDPGAESEYNLRQTTSPRISSGNVQPLSPVRSIIDKEIDLAGNSVISKAEGPELFREAE